jgi:hypothetical protein
VPWLTRRSTTFCDGIWDFGAHPWRDAAHPRSLDARVRDANLQVLRAIWSYDDAKQHAAGILERLQDGSMPCDGAWPQEKIEAFQRWTETGMDA